ncbi:MAG: cation diffusion facilitator family transporter [Deltaproteobacteria bacterium]|nr:cation diffusion facilitator family transporter [Deltaproteobacteria bacterium]
MAHSNSSHVHHHARTNAESLRVAFAITSLVLVLEAVGGVLTGSVALLADAGHMLTDAGALGIALFAARISVRPRDAQKSFGYGRAEILAALANGLLLGGVSVGIALESFERLGTRHTIAAGPMIAIASIGLVANLVSAHFLSQTAKKNLNVRAALLHVLGDALSSVAAIVAGVLILFWNVVSADAIAGLVIAALLVASAFRLIRSSVDILLEGAPGHLDLRQIASEVRELPGVMDIHDLHIWTVSEGFLAMSAHVDLRTGANAETVRRAVHRLLHQGYDIMHTTIQTEEGPGLLSIEAEPNSS